MHDTVTLQRALALMVPTLSLAEQFRPQERALVPYLVSLTSMFHEWRRAIDVTDQRSLAPFLYFSSFASVLVHNLTSDPKSEGAALLHWLCNSLARELSSYVAGLPAESQSLLEATTVVDARPDLQETVERQVFEGTPMGVLSRTLAPTYFAPANKHWCNRKFEELLGYDADEIYKNVRNGSAFYNIVHPSSVSEAMTVMWETIRSRASSWTRVVTYIRKDGEVISVMVTQSIRYSDAGVPLRHVTFFQECPASL